MTTDTDQCGCFLRNLARKRADSWSARTVHREETYLSLLCLVISDEPVPGCHGQGWPENSCAGRVSFDPDINH